MRALKRIVQYISIAAILAGISVMVGMLVWSYRLDDDFSASYACCTQEASAQFHHQFWEKFTVGEELAMAGCLLLSATLSSKAALTAGRRMLLTAAGILCVTFLRMNLHGWSGASAITLIGVVFCGGMVLLLTGAGRLAWMKFRS